jgi:hypothetical protein
MATQLLQVVFLADGWCSVKVPEIDHAVDVLVEEVNGRPEIVGLRLRPAEGGEPFGDEPPYDPDTEDVGGVRLDELWAWERRELATFIKAKRPVLNAHVLRRLRLAEIRRAVVATEGTPEPLFTRAATFSNNRRQRSDEFLTEVAQLYRAAIAKGQRPRPIIAAHYGVTDPTVKQWLAAARARGILGRPSRPGVAGFQEEPAEPGHADKTARVTPQQTERGRRTRRS